MRTEYVPSVLQSTGLVPPVKPRTVLSSSVKKQDDVVYVSGDSDFDYDTSSTFSGEFPAVSLMISLTIKFTDSDDNVIPTDKVPAPLATVPASDPASDPAHSGRQSLGSTGPFHDYDTDDESLPFADHSSSTASLSAAGSGRPSMTSGMSIRLDEERDDEMGASVSLSTPHKGKSVNTTTTSISHLTADTTIGERESGLATPQEEVSTDEEVMISTTPLDPPPPLPLPESHSHEDDEREAQRGRERETFSLDLDASLSAPITPAASTASRGGRGRGRGRGSARESGSTSTGRGRGRGKGGRPPSSSKKVLSLDDDDERERETEREVSVDDASTLLLLNQSPLFSPPAKPPSPEAASTSLTAITPATTTSVSALSASSEHSLSPSHADSLSLSTPAVEGDEEVVVEREMEPYDHSTDTLLPFSDSPSTASISQSFIAAAAAEIEREKLEREREKKAEKERVKAEKERLKAEKAEKEREKAEKKERERKEKEDREREQKEREEAAPLMGGTTVPADSPPHLPIVPKKRGRKPAGYTSVPVDHQLVTIARESERETVVQGVVDYTSLLDLSEGETDESMRGTKSALLSPGDEMADMVGLSTTPCAPPPDTSSVVTPKRRGRPPRKGKGEGDVSTSSAATTPIEGETETVSTPAATTEGEKEVEVVMTEEREGDQFTSFPLLLSSMKKGDRSSRKMRVSFGGLSPIEKVDEVEKEVVPVPGEVEKEVESIQVDTKRSRNRRPPPRFIEEESEMSTRESNASLLGDSGIVADISTASTVVSGISVLATAAERLAEEEKEREREKERETEAVSAVVPVSTGKRRGRKPANDPNRSIMSEVSTTSTVVREGGDSSIEISTVSTVSTSSSGNNNKGKKRTRDTNTSNTTNNSNSNIIDTSISAIDSIDSTSNTNTTSHTNSIDTSTVYYDESISSIDTTVTTTITADKTNDTETVVESSELVSVDNTESVSVDIDTSNNTNNTTTTSISTSIADNDTEADAERETESQVYEDTTSQSQSHNIGDSAVSVTMSAFVSHKDKDLSFMIDNDNDTNDNDTTERDKEIVETVTIVEERDTEREADVPPYDDGDNYPDGGDYEYGGEDFGISAVRESVDDEERERDNDNDMIDESVSRLVPSQSRSPPSGTLDTSDDEDRDIVRTPVVGNGLRRTNVRTPASAMSLGAISTPGSDEFPRGRRLEDPSFHLGDDEDEVPTDEEALDTTLDTSSHHYGRGKKGEREVVDEVEEEDEDEREGVTEGETEVSTSFIDKSYMHTISPSNTAYQRGRETLREREKQIKAAVQEKQREREKKKRGRRGSVEVEEEEYVQRERESDEDYEEEDEDGGPVRRSKRATKGKRFAFWKNERPVYQEGALVGVVQAEATPAKKARGRGKGAAAGGGGQKGRKRKVVPPVEQEEEREGLGEDDRLFDSFEEEEMSVRHSVSQTVPAAKKGRKGSAALSLSHSVEGLEPLDESLLPTGVTYTRADDLKASEGELSVWDNYHEKTSREKVVCCVKNVGPPRELPRFDDRPLGKDKVGSACPLLSQREVTGQMPAWTAGYIDLPPGAIKDAEGIGQFAQLYFVSDAQPGSLEFGLADPRQDYWDDSTAQRVLLGPGDSFYVPPGNIYRLENHSLVKACKLHWVIFMPISDPNYVAGSSVSGGTVVDGVSA